VPHVSDVSGDDAGYLPYVATALGAEVLGGLVIGVLIYLARSGIVLRDRLPELIQAHGWLQLQGWAGLFVAGMAQRLIPRLAGRPPVKGATVPIFLLLAAGALLRPVGQVAGGAAGTGLILLAAGAASAGCLAVAAVLASVLGRSRAPRAGWLLFAWAGCAWWIVWSGLGLWGGLLAARNGGLVPAWFDEPSVLVVMLGSIGAFIWAIQSRMVPVFFGRRPPGARALLGPAALYNLGVLVLLGSLIAAALQSAGTPSNFAAGGLGLTGAGLVWLALAGGSVAGVAHRLRPASQALGRFVVSANRWSIAAGVMWAVALLGPVLYAGTPRHSLNDAALHAFGTGVVTMLIAGMVQMVAPVFARARMDAPAVSLVERAIWPLLLGATVTRVGAGLAEGIDRGQAFTVLAGLSGVLGWTGLALLTLRLLLAYRRNAILDAGLTSH
jgi:hypothetical protein